MTTNGTPPSPAPGAREQMAGPVTTLRGAGVRFDARRVGRVVIAIVEVSLLVAAVLLLVANIHSNDQITELHDQGVPVTLTVSKCLGLLGGSGSNAAGYSCRGTYTLDGHHYNEQIPGLSFHSPGTKLRALAVPSDPALMNTVQGAASQHTTNVVVLPAVLVAIMVLSLGVLALRRRDGRANEAP